MLKREVTKTKKDTLGNITHLCNSFEYWSPISKNDVINDIESKTHSYFVQINHQEVDIIVVNGSSGKYLRTDPDKTKKNNLDELPDC